MPIRIRRPVVVLPAIRALTLAAATVCAAGCTDAVTGPSEGDASTLVFSRGPLRSPSGEWPSGIHRLSMAGGEPSAFVAAEGRDVAPLPSPDGRWVAFARSSCCVGGYGQVVMIAPAAGGTARVLVPDRAFPLAWSPDGRWLYVDGSFGAERGGVYRVDPTTGTRERVTTSVGSFFSPAPDGRRFVLSAGDYHVSLALFVGEIGVTALTPLAPGVGPLAYNPQWSPDGSRIAFLVRGGAGVAGLYTIRPDGADRRRLVPGNVVTGMRWSPDGASIALTVWDTTSTPAGQEDVYRIAADGSGLTNLTRTPERESGVAWSPDGRWLAFLASDETQQNDLYRMRPDGTQRVRLTNTPELSEGPPAWLAPSS